MMVPVVGTCAKKAVLSSDCIVITLVAMDLVAINACFLLSSCSERLAVRPHSDSDQIPHSTVYTIRHFSISAIHCIIHCGVSPVDYSSGEQCTSPEVKCRGKAFF